MLFSRQGHVRFGPLCLQRSSRRPGRVWAAPCCGACCQRPWQLPSTMQAPAKFCSQILCCIDGLKSEPPFMAMFWRHLGSTVV